MAERATHVYSHRPHSDAFDEEINAPNNGSNLISYQFARSTNADFPSDDSMPMFLSTQGDDPERQEFEDSWDSDYQSRRTGSSRWVSGMMAASALAIVAGLFAVDATRSVILNATASIAGALPVQSATAPPELAKLTASDIQLKEPGRVSSPAVQTTASANAGPSVAVAAPTREAITSAYQSALQGRAAPTPPVAAPAVAAPVASPVAAAPPARRIDADELASLMNRAKDLIAVGDIAPARLLLERAADGQEASAALLLAQTYDPAVLGTPDMRSITPDPAKARSWYQKAAKLGSLNAQARLTQIQN